MNSPALLMTFSRAAAGIACSSEVHRALDMSEFSDIYPVLPDVFGAVSNPARRNILDELCHGPRTAGELTGLLDLSRSAPSEHLAVLREAGLVREERHGRHRLYPLQPAGLAEVSGWVNRHDREHDPARAPPTAPAPEHSRMGRAHHTGIAVPCWAPGDIAPTVGHRFTMDMGPWGQQQCEILAVEPGELINFLFSEGQLDTTVTWRLETVEDGTVLHL
jgi:DNA-binding transcriptional ArsR family regulator